MRAKLAEHYDLIAVFVLAVAACRSPLNSNRDAGDARASSFDLALASEPPAERNPPRADAAPDAGGPVAEVGPDTPMLGNDSAGDRPDLGAEVGPDTPALGNDSASDPRDLGTDIAPDAPAAGPDGSGLDSPPVIAWDSGLDGGTVRRDSARVDQGTGLDGGGPLLCTGALMAGNFLPFAYAGGDTVAVGDLDHDGNLDLVIGDDYVNRVLLGKGDGTFAARVDYVSEVMMYGLALVDVNADGRLDVVTANRDGTVGVRLGKGDGTLAAEQKQVCGGEPLSLATADFDGDGHLDVATANYFVDTVSVLLGKGDGTFVAKVDYAAGDGPRWVLAGDLNGDRRSDLVVVGGPTGSVSVLLGQGGGTFADKMDAASPMGSLNVVSSALADVNGDTKPDLVIAAYPQEVFVYLGIGDGTFADPVYYLGNPGALADVNGDGKLDLVLGGQQGVSVLLGQGDGTFATEVDSPGSVGMGVDAVGDFNGDGKLDLVGSLSGWVGVLLGSGDGSFGPSTSSLPTAGSATSVALVDLDRDGRLDIVTSGGTGPVSTFLGKGDGTFAARADTAAGTGLGSLALGDLDGDGRLDIAGATGTTVSVLLGTSGGGFGPAASYETTAELVSALALGDVNGDGKLDIVTTNSRGAGHPIDKGTASVLLGTGNGQFGTHVDYAVGSDPGSVALGDVNGDGKLDIVVANIGYEGYLSSLGVLLGTGDGTFAAQTEYGTAGRTVTALALGDLNADGTLDVVTVNASGSARVLLGNGDGTFSTVDCSVCSPAGNTSSVVLVDVNGDSVLDIVTAGDVVTVLFGQGDGTFPSGASYAAEAGAVALGDLNRDGRLDLVTAASDGIDVLLGSCH
jgi:hypothetical protein